MSSGFSLRYSAIFKAMGKTTGGYTKKAIKSPDGVRTMFDVVARRYDMLNRLLTAGMDQRWRRLAARNTGANKDSVVLDACTGTGDLALAINSITGSKVVGVDFSKDMLEVARDKFAKAGVNGNITLAEASVDNLPFEENRFDAITIGWGLRNTPDYRAVLREFHRVTRPGGRLVCLESNQPEPAIFRIPYRWLLRSFVPLLGRVFSKNYGAYKYLSDSIQVFPPQKELVKMMEEAGWGSVWYKNLFFGAVAIHVATKPPENDEG